MRRAFATVVMPVRLLQAGCLSFVSRNAECDGERADAATKRELAELLKAPSIVPSEKRKQ